MRERTFWIIFVLSGFGLASLTHYMGQSTGFAIGLWWVGMMIMIARFDVEGKLR